MRPGDPQPDAARAALGAALGARSEECVRLSEERLDEHRWVGSPPSPVYLHSRRAVLWFGTLLVARWLVSGIVPDGEEVAGIQRRGRLAVHEGISIVNFARAYLVWRDVLVEVLTEEAARLGSGDAALQLAVGVVRASCDGYVLRVVRNFDEHLRDLNAQLEEERQLLHHAASHDGLTGVRNRVSLYERLAGAVEAASRAGEPLAVMMVDLDGFKQVNDRLGHRFGDLALAEAAARLAQAVRSVDIVARIGGDEFIVVLPCSTATAAADVAARVIDHLSEPLLLGASRVVLGASIGIAEHPRDGEGVDALLAAADAAMYVAKRDTGWPKVAFAGHAA